MHRLPFPRSARTRAACAVLKALLLPALVAAWVLPLPVLAQSRDVLVVNMDLSDAITADPAEGYETGSGLMARQAYETLVTYEGERIDQVSPLLAASWEPPDPGSHRWLFHLNPDARFADGSPVTAGDVVYSFDRALALRLTPVWLLEIIGYAQGGGEAVDERTVALTFETDLSPDIVLAVLTFPVASVINKDVAEAHASGGDFGHAWLREHTAGSGPYVLERWERDAQMIFVENPNYWRDPPGTARVVVRHVPESTSQALAVARGDADLAVNLSPQQARDLEDDPNVQIVRVQRNVLIYLGLNTGFEPFADPRVGQAIRYAIDYDGLIGSVLSDSALPIQTILPHGFFGFNDRRPYTHDVERARTLLAEAGYPDGFSVELLVPTGPDPAGVPYTEVATKIQSDLAAVGIQAQIRTLTGAALLERYRAQETEMVLMYWGADYADPDSNAKAFGDASVRQLAYRNRWNAPEIGEMVQAAAVERDRARRAELYRQVTDAILEEGPYVILYQPLTNYAFSRDVTSYVLNPQLGLAFAPIRKE